MADNKPLNIDVDERGLTDKQEAIKERFQEIGIEDLSLAFEIQRAMSRVKATYSVKTFIDVIDSYSKGYYTSEIAQSIGTSNDAIQSMIKSFRRIDKDFFTEKTSNNSNERFRFDVCKGIATTLKNPDTEIAMLLNRMPHARRFLEEFSKGLNVRDIFINSFPAISYSNHGQMLSEINANIFHRMKEYGTLHLSSTFHAYFCAEIYTKLENDPIFLSQSSKRFYIKARNLIMSYIPSARKGNFNSTDLRYKFDFRNLIRNMSDIERYCFGSTNIGNYEEILQLPARQLMEEQHQFPQFLLFQIYKGALFTKRQELANYLIERIPKGKFSPRFINGILTSGKKFIENMFTPSTESQSTEKLLVSRKKLSMNLCNAISQKLMSMDLREM